MRILILLLLFVTPAFGQKPLPGARSTPMEAGGDPFNGHPTPTRPYDNDDPAEGEFVRSIYREAFRTPCAPVPGQTTMEARAHRTRTIVWCEEKLAVMRPHGDRIATFLIAQYHAELREGYVGKGKSLLRNMAYLDTSPVALDFLTDTIATDLPAYRTVWNDGEKQRSAVFTASESLGIMHSPGSLDRLLTFSESLGSEPNHMGADAARGLRAYTRQHQRIPPGMRGRFVALQARMRAREAKKPANRRSYPAQMTPAYQQRLDDVRARRAEVTPLQKLDGDLARY